MNPLALIVAAALVHPSGPETRVVTVEVLEVNIVTGRFVQIVGWDRCENTGQPIDRGWKVIQSHEPIGVYRRGEWWEASWDYGGKVLVVRSKQFLRTETPFDREAEWRHRGGIYRSAW